MNRFLEWLRPGRAPAHTTVEQKAAQPLIAFHGLGEASWSFSGQASLARQGFARNPVVYRCVRMVAEAAASLPLILYEDEAELSAHPLLELLARPGPRQAGRAFLETLYGHLLVSGNAYVHAVAIDGQPRELHLLRPDRVDPVTDAAGWPVAYDYRTGNRKLRIDAEGEPAAILHIAQFNPIEDFAGLPPLAAAHMALDIHDAASCWNKALLDNSARPSGALVYTAAEGGNLTAEQFDRLKSELEEGYSGATRAGRPMLLEGGLDWKAMGYSPRDMDFIEARNGAARDIALAFGVPPMLLGIPGDNTYANYQEANRALWRQTVLPLAARLAETLGGWLAGFFGAGLRLEIDADDVVALAADREALWRRLNEASFLSDDEKRAAAGYEPLRAQAGPADRRELAQKYNPNWHDQPRVPAGDPDGGQWTDGGGGGAGDDEILLHRIANDGKIHVAQVEPGRRFDVDLHEEEAAGGHAIARHVGRSPSSLIEYVRRHQYSGLSLRFGVRRDGSFPSIDAATRLVNATLSRNREIVEKVGKGEVGGAFVTSVFKSRTGVEAYMDGLSRPYLRDTYGVGVYIIHDPKAEKGFRVVTAYPRNE